MIFNEEYARAGCPTRLGFFGEQLLGPTLMALGTPEQQARFLGPILRAEEYWCQGFSEPDAGSDLANIKTTAELELDLLGPSGLVAGDELVTDFQYTFLFSRAHTIYARSSEIQRNIIGERVLGLPRDPVG